MIIIDNISTLCRAGAENKADDWNIVQDWALQMRSQGRSVMFIYHADKGGQQRGTSKREDVLDTVISLRHPTDYSPEKVFRSIPDSELKQCAGDEWAEIKEDPESPNAFAELVLTSRMRERGEVPAGYTEITECLGCGTVPIFPGVPGSVIGCPWCFNRLSGKPMLEVNDRRSKNLNQSDRANL